LKWVTFFAIVIFWCAFSEVRAGEIQHASVDFAHGEYSVEFDGQVSAVPAEVYRLVTDHNHLDLLNDDVLESVLLTPPTALIKKRRVVLHICILFFCRDMKLVELLKENGNNILVATVVPAESDFDYGRTIWQVTPAGTMHSQLQLRSTFRPAFWVPPVIGPWLIKIKMEQELSVMITRLEHYAGAARSH
jgi:hypothetical protein